ncbi:hypothetical protein PAXRUDRAFT_36957 [Paxillus rubicundulus Ve08.2h10]|uniref:CxC2-like cysteine cluster KDZ transposase-associated domain-containing protein n=1 Tax=Paxillus rubicundulus Ve08.2h10 TaxID=930991 RepID=A0A0D0CXF0_9AGAM|nr:hypothetical protein PAXRUDRAFT_36957 [Paxillus rubicundulus Ve08.2h10]
MSLCERYCMFCLSEYTVLNACPPCFYQLQDEPKLDFDWLVSIDGNNSLNEEYIDKFQYEVKAQTTQVAANDDKDDWETEILPDLPSQAKYPLTIVDCLLSVYGANAGCAYDIGCAFSKTVKNSVLKLKAHSLNLHCMVGAFHSYAHNRKCQIDWHPMYIQGTGNTEGEGCEHVFSSSNELAQGTHHSSHCHWHQAIEQHFAFWNEDKYEALKQVYLELLKQPPLEDQVAIHYVQWKFACESANCAMSGVPEGNPNAIAAVINRACIQVDLAYSKLQNAEALAAHIQTQLGLEAPWQVGGEEYSRYKEEVPIAKYHKALDELECLVVMRLFKLSKLSMSGTAPRASVSWKDITNYTFLGEFDLLCHSCTHIQDYQWSEPEIHEATAKYFKVCCAQEEITQLSVEIGRLRTAIHNEEKETSRVITIFLESELLLGQEIQQLYCQRAAVNAVHLHCLDQI